MKSLYFAYLQVSRERDRSRDRSRDKTTRDRSRDKSAEKKSSKEEKKRQKSGGEKEKEKEREKEREVTEERQDSSSKKDKVLIRVVAKSVMIAKCENHFLNEWISSKENHYELIKNICMW